MKNRNTLVKRKAFVNTVRIMKGADLGDEFLFQILAAFRRTYMKGKAAESHVFFGVVREIKVTSDWLRCILIILLNIAEVFEESVA